MSPSLQTMRSNDANFRSFPPLRISLSLHLRSWGAVMPAAMLWFQIRGPCLWGLDQITCFPGGNVEVYSGFGSTIVELEQSVRASPCYLPFRVLSLACVPLRVNSVFS